MDNKKVNELFDLAAAEQVKTQQQAAKSLPLEVILQGGKPVLESRYIPTNLSEEIELIRRIAKTDGAKQFLIQAGEENLYQELVILAKSLGQNILEDNREKYASLQLPRSDKLLVHAYLVGDISTDQMVEALLAAELLNRSKFHTISFLQDKTLSSFGHHVLQTIEVDVNNYKHLVDELVESKYNVHCWLVPNAAFTQPLERELIENAQDYSDFTFCHYDEQTKERNTIIYPPQLFQRILKAKFGEDAIKTINSLGISNLLGIGRATSANGRILSLIIQDVTSLQKAHGKVLTNISAYVHDALLHIWKCSSIPAGMRRAFLYIATLIYYLKDYDDVELLNIPEIKCRIVCSKFFQAHQSKFTDMEFSERFGNFKNYEQKLADFARILEQLQPNLLLFLVRDMIINENFWRENFGFCYDNIPFSDLYLSRTRELTRLVNYLKAPSIYPKETGSAPTMSAYCPS